MRSIRILLALAAFAGCAIKTPGVSESSPVRAMASPSYGASGELLRPRDFPSWVFVGSSMGLSYSENGSSKGPGTFHNVYLNPPAYEEYTRTGKFPERTMLVLALYEPKEKESIQRAGYFEGNLVALEAAVKEQARFPETWAYFDFGKGGADEKAKPFPKASCHDCHKEHGAVDNVFVQFYPVLRDLKMEGSLGAGSSSKH